MGDGCGVTLPVANVVWPALVVVGVPEWFHTILASLVIETLALRAVWPVRMRVALAAAVLANLASTVLGLMLVPLVGFAAAIATAWAPTFSVTGWVATAVAAAGVNTVVELGVLSRLPSRLGLRDIDWKTTAWAFGTANLVTASIAAYYAAHADLQF